MKNSAMIDALLFVGQQLRDTGLRTAWRRHLCMTLGKRSHASHRRSWAVAGAWGGRMAPRSQGSKFLLDRRTPVDVPCAGAIWRLGWRWLLPEKGRPGTRLFGRMIRSPVPLNHSHGIVAQKAICCCLRAWSTTCKRMMDAERNSLLKT